MSTGEVSRFETKTRQRINLGRTLLSGLKAGAAAFALDLVVYALAYFVLRIPMTIPMAPGSDAIVRPSIIQVAVAVFIPALLAALLLAFLLRFSNRGLVIFQLFSVIFMMLSLSAPLSLPKDVTTLSTRLTLALMHVVSAAAIIGVLTHEEGKNVLAE